MSDWSTLRDALATQLNAVSGIGNVYLYQATARDEAEFLSKFVSNSKINYCILYRESAFESADIDYGSRDETNEQEIVERNEVWIIRLMYGYDENASEATFQELIDAIMTKFRFQQTLGGAFDIEPPELVSTQIWQMVSGQYLCHRADIKLICKFRKIKT
jgi:hypothetical protein